MRVFKVGLCFILFLVFGSLARGQDQSLKQVSLVTLWVPQAQFAGYYVAKQKGIYKKYGLDVLIIDGTPERAPVKLLEDKLTQFGVVWLSSAIEKRSQGAHIVNIAQIVRKSGLMLVAKKSSGIRLASDMKNKKVGLWEADFQIQPRAFFKKYNLEVQVVPQTFSVNLFLRGGVDVASAMWYNEYHTILNSGYDSDDLATFFFYDHGLNFPEDGLYALEETVVNDPLTCRAFVRASLEGWQYVFDNPEEAVDIVLKYMEQSHLPANRMHQKWMLERMKDLILVNGSYPGMGKLSVEDYLRVAGVLKDNALIKDIPEFSIFYKDCSSDEKK
jgi:NitT/TauT family transport system substrate-binding protein